MKSIIVNQLVRSYKKVEALKGVSFDVNRGEIFGIIGPDGRCKECGKRSKG